MERIKADVLIIGAGTVGTHAAKIACGPGAKVYLLDTDLDRLRYLADVMPRTCIPLILALCMARPVITGMKNLVKNSKSSVQ